MVMRTKHLKRVRQRFRELRDRIQELEAELEIKDIIIQDLEEENSNYEYSFMRQNPWRYMPPGYYNQGVRYD